jgi:hypothetical protein
MKSARTRLNAVSRLCWLLNQRDFGKPYPQG